MLILRQSTAGDVLIGPFVDKTDGITVEAGKTLDVELSKNGQGLANKSDSTAPTDDAGAHVRGYYNCELDATDTNTVGTLRLCVHHTDALPVWHDFQVVEEAIYDALFAGSATGELLVDVAKISGDATAANNLELMYDGTGYAGGTAKLGVDVVKVSGDSTAADNMELMFDGTGYAGGTAKLGVNVLTVEGVDATDAIQTSASASLIAYNLDHLMKTAVADNADMTTEITNGSVLSNIMTKTGDTSDYAYATDSLEGLAGVWTTALTESYASDGAAATPAQLLYMIYCAVGEFSISSTTITGKKLDGSTTAMTWTIDSASEPTSRTRAG